MGRLEVKVVPGASRDGIAGWLGDRLKIRVRQPPEGGRANAAVTELLAEALGVPPEDVTLVAGDTSPRKSFTVAGLDDRTIRDRLGSPGSPP